MVEENNIEGVSNKYNHKLYKFFFYTTKDIFLIVRITVLWILLSELGWNQAYTKNFKKDGWTAVVGLI